MPPAPLFNRGLAFTAGIVAIAFFSAFFAARTRSQNAAAQSSDAASHGVLLSSMDKTCKPCEDFYHYANGAWIKNNPIPPEYPLWSPEAKSRQQNREHLRQILDQAAASQTATQDPNERKIGDFYASCMDVRTVNAASLKPLDPELERIAAIRNVADLQAEVARLQSHGVGAMFGFGSLPDAKNSSQVIAVAYQAGLGLPDRDYYTKTDSKSAQIRQEYVAHVTKMLVLAGEDSAKAKADAETTMSIETKLAEASLTDVEMRDPQKVYHKMGMDELASLTPNFSWAQYFKEIGQTNIQSVNVMTPKFFAAMSEDFKAIPLHDWKVYLRWQLVNAVAGALSGPFVNEDFAFNGAVLQGTKQLEPRWQRCVEATDANLGQALGQAYVKKYFPPEAKARALQMVNNVTAALHDDLETLPWMGEATRREALTKLETLNKKIGYPDKWRDYSAYTVDRGPYVLNVMRGAEFEFNRDLNKIGKPVDRTEWGMTPPTVDAYYDASLNEIVFPAGILQHPLFDPQADDASNYGAIGAVIGHEITHGFDDYGRQYDAQGNLRDWWTPQDEKNFNERAACVEKQFDGYVVAGDMHENGKLVLGEAIADFGGLVIAYRALEKDLQGKPQPLIGGLTPQQRFFLAYAQLWGGNVRPEAERTQTLSDEHPLRRFRGIAGPSNMPEFQIAFDCKDGDAMVRPAALRCQIW